MAVRCSMWEVKKMAPYLSPALEDYLRAITDLSEQEIKGVRISDIANKLNIAKPSVIQAVSDLKKKGLVKQEPYSPVYLTREGLKKGREVTYRHDVIRAYLECLLSVSPITAEHDACRMEHIISEQTFKNMEQKLRGVNLLDQEVWSGRDDQPLTLAALRPGEKGRIKKVGTQDTVLRRRLLDMGVVPGAELLVERMAPLGDPIEIEIQGFHLSLRCSEAEMVIVEQI